MLDDADAPARNERGEIVKHRELTCCRGRFLDDGEAALAGEVVQRGGAVLVRKHLEESEASEQLSDLLESLVGGKTAPFFGVAHEHVAVLERASQDERPRVAIAPTGGRIHRGHPARTTGHRFELV